MKRGEIWLTEIPSSGGHGQYGFRPVIIIQTTKTNVITIIQEERISNHIS